MPVFFIAPVADGNLATVNALLLFRSDGKRVTTVHWGIGLLNIHCRHKPVLVAQLNLPPILQNIIRNTI